MVVDHHDLTAKRRCSRLRVYLYNRQTDRQTDRQIVSA
jgi:hypothetical protein